MIGKDSANVFALRRMSRRTFLKIAGATGAIAFFGTTRGFGMLPPLTGCGIIEALPTSPFIVSPFIDDLPQLKTMAPGWRPDPTLPAGQAEWTVRKLNGIEGSAVSPPSPELSRQDSYGFLPERTEVMHGITVTLPEHAGTHQVWPVPHAPVVDPNGNIIGGNFNRLINWPAAGVDPILYHIRLQLGTHKFTTSKVRPIGSGGITVPLPPDAPVQLDPDGLATLPDSVVYGFNGTFPGAMINVEYGKPVLVRFENDLDKNPLNLDRQDFGAPDWAFLTHLHNGHTAPESDGNPNYMQIHEGGYIPGDWVDDLYLNYPAGGDPSEMQAFLWFHDHRMHHTGANVYKGMVGLMPIYDPGMPDPNNPGQILPGTGLDPGDETKGLRLPGIRVDHPNGTFDVKYDIHMALYDVALDDGVTPHADMHTDPAVCGNTHPEWWGKTFFKHFPNHGFVGDIFTVNCTAFPVLHVFKRRYRFRFLDASVARIYELALMTSTNGPQPRPGTQGQWQIPDGVQWKPWTMIASMGGLLPEAEVTDTFNIWPASRLCFEVDFTNAQEGDVIYITNVLEMPNGRKQNFNVNVPLNALPYKVPLVKIIVGGAPPEPDLSVPVINADGTKRQLRPMPKLENGTGAAITLATTAALPHKEFTLVRSGRLGEEESWLINDLPFEPMIPLTTVVRDKPEVWTNRNGGGGWVHPMHMHEEEHTVIARVGSTLPIHPEDAGKADVTNLEPGESITFYRNFRTFTGRYVAHCHNLAHEDHNMMFGFSILDAAPVGAFAISGTVTDRAGAPMAGVTVRLDGAAVKTTTTNAGGNYSFAALADGNYTITPTLTGVRFAPRRRNVTVKGASLTARNFRGIA